MGPADQLRQSPDADNPQDEPEKELWAGNYSAKTMIVWWVALGLLTVLMPFCILFAQPDNRTATGIVVLVLLTLFWHGTIGVALYRKLFDHYWLTSQRLKHRSGILFRQSNRLELIDIDDVSFSQGPIQALMGLGKISIRSSDSSHPELELVGIENVAKVADMIDDARREERRKRGLHIEAI